MIGLGYYTMVPPQEDTLETPYPVAFDDEIDEPVPGWGMNPLLAGPPIIAVGDAASMQSTQAEQIYVAMGVLIVGAFVYDALKRDKRRRRA